MKKTHKNLKGALKNHRRSGQAFRAWVADATGGDHYVAVFNLGDSPHAVELNWNELGVKAASAEVRDLWSRKSLGRQPGVKVQLRPHASVLYRISNLM